MFERSEMARGERQEKCFGASVERHIGGRAGGGEEWGGGGILGAHHHTRDKEKEPEIRGNERENRTVCLF